MGKFIFATLAVLMASEVGAATLPTVVRAGNTVTIEASTPVDVTIQVPTPMDVTVCVRRRNSIAGLNLTRCRYVGTLQ
jgi:hypothetical protein